MSSSVAPVLGPGPILDDVRVLASALAPLLLLQPGCGQREKTAPPTPLVEQMRPVDPARTIEGTLLVAGMTCSGCEYNVSTALRLVDGVLEAAADHASGEVRVRFDPSRTTLASLAEAVRTTGYVVAPVEGSAKE
jgi:copper chaperone CopZ